MENIYQACLFIFQRSTQRTLLGHYFLNPPTAAVKSLSQSTSTFIQLKSRKKECLISPPTVRCSSTHESSSVQSPSYLDARDPSIMNILVRDMKVHNDFLSEEEETSLLDEVERSLKRQRYLTDHWDDAIHGYRETEKLTWSEKNTKIIERFRQQVFSKDDVPLPHVHILDISKEGFIKPHVDAIRFCGDTIAGLCLLSSCVMRLALEKDSSKYGDVYLPRRCLYVMRGRARYEFTHEVLKSEESVFKHQIVPRDRRISIICRNEPDAVE
ncbi:alpha-ketoglutarate-dependent dioxygenase alkB homolog 7, mitochondrial-like isoform X2 [Physella acuta]|uniref:alpha-ketoglutarate-dependent dioxygenase alkB homolog 7, mitochondrial-like isoform X2 n=1 Tax=Physella acuta TaxID=109671 RepID=UPI0027DE193B|nr:alpha-ketoglutarate-dependent dioxygenase alkB homolog 7, mitochondrial-like isoform X2 [Physella acuta]